MRQVALLTLVAALSACGGSAEASPATSEPMHRWQAIAERTFVDVGTIRYGASSRSGWVMLLVPGGTGRMIAHVVVNCGAQVVMVDYAKMAVHDPALRVNDTTIEMPTSNRHLFSTALDLQIEQTFCEGAA